MSISDFGIHLLKHPKYRGAVASTIRFSWPGSKLSTALRGRFTQPGVEQATLQNPGKAQRNCTPPIPGFWAGFLLETRCAKCAPALLDARLLRWNTPIGKVPTILEGVPFIQTLRKTLQSNSFMIPARVDRGTKSRPAA